MKIRRKKGRRMKKRNKFHESRNDNEKEEKKMGKGNHGTNLDEGSRKGTT